MPFVIPPSECLTVGEVLTAQRWLSRRPRCRRCPALVEVFDLINWSSQCAFHNDEDADLRREYGEDEARYREEMEIDDADD